MAPDCDSGRPGAGLRDPEGAARRQGPRPRRQSDRRGDGDRHVAAASRISGRSRSPTRRAFSRSTSKRSASSISYRIREGRIPDLRRRRRTGAWTALSGTISSCSRGRRRRLTPQSRPRRRARRSRPSTVGSPPSRSRTTRMPWRSSKRRWITIPSCARRGEH